MKLRMKNILLVLTLGIGVVLQAQTAVENPLAPYIPKNMKRYYLDLLKSDKAEGTVTPAENAERMSGRQALPR